MSASNKGSNVDPRLQNISNSLYLDSNDDVVVRTGFAGDIIVSGTVNIPGVVEVFSDHDNPLHSHVENEPGTSLAITGTVAVSSLPPITGTVAVSNFPSSITVTNFTSTVNIASIPEVEIKNDAGKPISVSANNNSNTALNPIYVTGTVTTTGGSAQGKLWYFQVAQGLIPGTSSIFKAGYNPSVANNSEESLWGHSTLYPWDSWGAGGTLSCVSASDSDTGTLHITGLLSSDWTEVTEIVTLTGTIPVVTTNSFIRINVVHYFHTSANVGEIDVSRNGTIVGCILAGQGQGQMAQYTVPAGYTAYVLSGNSNLGKGNDGVGRFKYRTYGSSFQTAMVFLLYQSSFDYTFQAPLVVPEKTDLDVTLVASNAGTACTCAYSVILIAN